MPIKLPLPGDVDLSQLDFMPTYDARLMKSRAWLRAKNWRDPAGARGPGLGFVIFNLWAFAFRAVPAGSIEACDDVLADAARCDIDYWVAIKDVALTGWELIGDRWHHPVVSEIAYGVWMGRLEARHENARRSWSMTAKRKHDQGLDVPDPPPCDLATWIRVNYPQTAAYMDSGFVSSAASYNECDGNKVTCTSGVVSDFRPKQSIGKGNTPPEGSPRPVRARNAEPGVKGAAGKDWFATEERRLHGVFGGIGGMAGSLQSVLQRRGESPRYSFVRALRGAWLDPDGPAIVLPSIKAAANLRDAIGEAVAQMWPTLTIRHATVDELRSRKSEAAA